jgi:DNA-binding ferritin-like protein (Dps family)
MGIHVVIEGKKQWRVHMARVKALPPDYQIVYKSIQRYLFKGGAGPVDLSDGTLLSGLVDFFEEGVAVGKRITELIGTDVAVFCDELIKDSHTYADINQQSLNWKPSTNKGEQR